MAKSLILKTIIAQIPALEVGQNNKRNDSFIINSMNPISVLNFNEPKFWIKFQF